MRREDLRRRGNIFRDDLLVLLEAGEDLLLLLRNVELIEPADDLDLFPVVLVDGCDELANEGVGVEKVVGQEQFGFVERRLPPCLVATVPARRFSRSAAHPCRAQIPIAERA
jgi:hypothetical protein